MLEPSSAAPVPPPLPLLNVQEQPYAYFIHCSTPVTPEHMLRHSWAPAQPLAQVEPQVLLGHRDMSDIMFGTRVWSPAPIEEHSLHVDKGSSVSQ